jgi:hypothetical protein
MVELSPLAPTHAMYTSIHIQLNFLSAQSGILASTTVLLSRIPGSRRVPVTALRRAVIGSCATAINVYEQPQYRTQLHLP